MFELNTFNESVDNDISMEIDSEEVMSRNSNGSNLITKMNRNFKLAA